MKKVHALLLRIRSPLSLRTEKVAMSRSWKFLYSYMLGSKIFHRPKIGPCEYNHCFVHLSLNLSRSHGNSVIKRSGNPGDCTCGVWSRSEQHKAPFSSNLYISIIESSSCLLYVFLYLARSLLLYKSSGMQRQVETSTRFLLSLPLESNVVHVCLCLHTWSHFRSCLFLSTL